MRTAFKLLSWLIPLLASLEAGTAWAQTQPYPPLSEYMMAAEDEVALARSAAPEGISSRATVKAPSFSPLPERELVYDAKLRAPICFNPVASRTVLPYQELRARLGISGKTPDQITQAVQAAYARGELPRIDQVGFGYMWSADQELGGPAPFVGDDAGTPFAVTVIRVDDRLAIEARRGR